MSAPTTPTRHLLADLLMTAATELTAAPAPEPDALHAALGVRVLRGRLTLGRARQHVPAPGLVSVSVGFNVAVWIGLPADMPRFAQESFTDRTTVASRGRLSLSKTVRMWLAVPDRDDFDVIPVPTDRGGLFLIPAHDYSRRWQEVARVDRPR